MLNIIDIRRGRDIDLFRRLTERTQLDRSDVLDKVNAIIKNIRENGDKAVFEYTRTFDKTDINETNFRVSEEEMNKALELVDKRLLEVIRKSKKNIESFHEKQKENSWITTGEDGVILGHVYRPLEVVGIYVPGGTAALASSVLMNAVPAKVAGVKKVIMATPPARDGSINAAILAAAREAGVDEIYKMGGAQAIAAMAFGTSSVPRVDKIFGPGNIYVATAKRMVYGYCDIDMFAGPSEIMVVADESANPKYIAADMLSQAEHDVLSAAILVTTSGKLAIEVDKEIERQFALLSRKDILSKSISDFSAAVIVNNLDEAIDVVNRIAPEHLELCIENAFDAVGSVKNAGAIFLGSYSSEPLGDYFAGPNHVLPTGGTARFFSTLNVGDFIKKTSLISYTRKALEKVRDDIVIFAEAEGLDGHANAIRVRFD